MEERDQILIERYLAGDLTDAERQEVERRRTTDSAFHAELTALEEARHALRLKQREDLKERFRKRDEILDKKKPETSFLKPPYIWVWIAAALLSGLLIWKLLLSDTKETAPVESEASDTSRYQEIPVVRIDTIRQSDTLHQQSTTEKQRPQKPDMAANTKKSQALFAEYYAPYKDAMMDPSTRGDEDLHTLQQFQKSYWEGDFNQAVRLFPQVSEQYRSNDNYRFMYASALLATDHAEKAIPFFKEIVDQHKSRYTTESLYALALAYLKKNDPEAAARWLDQYVKDDKAKQKEKAISLQKALKAMQEK